MFSLSVAQRLVCSYVSALNTNVLAAISRRPDILGVYRRVFDRTRTNRVQWNHGYKTRRWWNAGYAIQSSSFKFSSGRSLHTHLNLLSEGKPRELDDITFDKLADETLDELAEFFEDLGDSGLCSSDYDVSLSAGVLTITVGDPHGTYVINKQSPNRQIWFSSPKSGPKRYDVIDGRWRYLHDGMALHDLLRSEFSELMEVEIDLSQLKCSHIISDEENWTN